MSLSEVSKLGESLANTNRVSEELQQNINSNEDIGLDNIRDSSSININGRVTVKKLIYKEDSFILDHPVYGELDSPILKLDGGYDTFKLVMPLTMPLKLGTLTEILHNESF